jgi:hypothetical protein
MFDCVFHNKFKRWIPIRLVEGTNHTNKVVQLKTGYLTANLTISEFIINGGHIAPDYVLTQFEYPLTFLHL